MTEIIAANLCTLHISGNIIMSPNELFNDRLRLYANYIAYHPISSLPSHALNCRTNSSFGGNAMLERGNVWKFPSLDQNELVQCIPS